MTDDERAPCGWCHGEGAIRNADGKLSEDCPRCRGMSVLADSRVTVRLDLVDPQGTILREIADRRLTRDDVALTYVFVIRQVEDVDVAAINRAIIERWSVSGLNYIKKAAWRLVMPSNAS